MVDDFAVARNPDGDSQLPYLVRIPLGEHGVVLKSRETWSAEPEIVDRVAVRSCTRRGLAVDLVLDRGRENRSQFVFTRLEGGRDAIFWQTARAAKQARPKVSMPSARASGVPDLDVVVDSRTYRFLAAALVADDLDDAGRAATDSLARPPELPARPPTAAVRAWAAEQGHAVSDRGRVPGAVLAAYAEAHAGAEPR